MTPADRWRQLACALLVTALSAACASGGGAAARPRPTATSPSPATRGPDPPPSATQAAASHPVGILRWPSGRAFRLTVIGDSVGRRGSFASTPARIWWQLVLDRLRRHGSATLYGTYADHRVNGLTVFGGITDISAPGSDLVFVGMGLNDYRNGDPLDAYRRDYAALLDRVRASAVTATLVCFGLWQPSTARQASYDGAVAAACRAHGGVFVRWSRLYDDPANRLPRGVPAFGGYQTDGLHPNDRGQRAMAAQVVARLGI